MPKKPIIVQEYNDSGEYFDDCPICRAIKEAKERDGCLTLEAARAATKKVKTQKKLYFSR